MPFVDLRSVLFSGGRALFIAFAAILLAAGFRIFLGLLVPTDLSFTAMLPAILVATLFGGVGAGVWATVFGGIVAQWAFVPPYYEFAVPAFVDVGNLIAYAIAGAAMLWAAALYLRARRRAEANAAAAARLASIVTNSADAIVGLDRNGIVESWNRAAEGLFGYAAAEIVGRPASVLFPTDPDVRPVVPSMLLGKESAQFAAVWTAKGGRRIDVAVTTGPVHLSEGEWIGVAAIVRDVTREVAVDRALRDANRRNVLLLGEIHHRMRNNLQMIAGLIATCARQVDSEAARRQILGLEQRVSAISRIHEHLHRHADFGNVEVCTLLRQVVGDLVGLAGRPADMEIVGESDVWLRTDLAVPVILATSELVTNALMHAGRDRTTVKVRCGTEGASLVLAVSDNGRGLPPDFETTKGRTFGLRMASGAIDLLGGTLRALPTDSGAAFEIRVPLDRTFEPPAAPG